MMIDPILLTLAGRVAGLLKPLVEAGADELKKTVGVPVVDRLTGLLATLRERWAGDSEATETVTDFERDPAANEEALRDLLAQRMAADPELAATVDADVQAIGPRLIITMVGGHVGIQEGPEIEGISGRAQVNVTMKVDVADQQKAGKFGKIG